MGRWGRWSWWPSGLGASGHFDLSCCSGTTFRPAHLFQDDIWTYPTAPRRHFGVSCSSRTYPAALGRHFDLPSCSGTTFRPIQLLKDDISTYADAPGRHFDLSNALGRHSNVSCGSIRCTTAMSTDWHILMSRLADVHKWHGDVRAHAQSTNVVTITKRHWCAITCIAHGNCKRHAATPDERATFVYAASASLTATASGH